jgi:protein gp37
VPVTWNPWHGCRKISLGCANCYVYRIDARCDRDASAVTKNRDFDLPVRRTRKGAYKIPPGETVYTCFSSDFFLDEADAWRPDAWAMIRARSDLRFFMITKRIDRFHAGLPGDWGDGWDHVHVCSTAENQEMAERRLPVFREAPIRHKSVICEPLLGPVDLSGCLGPWVEEVVAGGESGPSARVCDYAWVLDLRAQCVAAGVPFSFKQTGAHLKKGERLYAVPRQLQHAQAKKAGIDWRPERSPLPGE